MTRAIAIIAVLLVWGTAPAAGEEHRSKKAEFAGTWEPGGFSFLEGTAQLRSHFQIHGGLVTRSEEDGEVVSRQGFFGLGPSLKTAGHGWHIVANPWAGVAVNGKTGLALGFHMTADHRLVEAESRAVFAASHRELGWQKIGLAAPLGEACWKIKNACLGAGIGRSGTNHPEFAVKWRIIGGLRPFVGVLHSHEGWKPVLGLELKH